MIKRGILLFILIILVAPMILATCNLDVNLINQDPYPAIPGDYVDVVFQITGVDNPACGVVEFEIKEEYPFSLDPDKENPISIRAGTYERGYSSFYIAPYKIRIDSDAIDGDNPIEVGYSSTDIELLKEFNINVEDSRADFEIFVKDYKPSTNIMTLEILNIEENDVEALTIEIPKQDNIEIKGPNRNVVGDLDSNEYTTAEFEAISSGGDIKLTILYTDSINARRSLEKTINFDPSYFTGRKSDQKGVNAGTWVVIVIVVIVLIWWWHKRKKKKRHAQHHARHHAHAVI